MVQRAWQVIKKRIKFHLNLKQETSHRLALGVAVGLFVSLTPTIGFQPFVALLLAALINANKVVSLLTTSISNPVTFFPIYYPSYRLGLYVSDRVNDPGFERVFNALRRGDWYWVAQSSFELWRQVFIPVLIGSLIIGAIVAFIGYFLAKFLIDYSRDKV